MMPKNKVNCIPILLSFVKVNVAYLNLRTCTLDILYMQKTDPVIISEGALMLQLQFFARE